MGWGNRDCWCTFYNCQGKSLASKTVWNHGRKDLEYAQRRYSDSEDDVVLDDFQNHEDDGDNGDSHEGDGHDPEGEFEGDDEGDGHDPDDPDAISSKYNIMNVRNSVNVFPVLIHVFISCNVMSSFLSVHTL